MLQQITGSSREDMKRLNDTIVNILRLGDIKHDDKSDKVEMLRKIELRLNYLLEARSFISDG